MTSRPVVRIFVGSETGFAHEIAKEVALDLIDHKIISGFACDDLPVTEVEIHMMDEFLSRSEPFDSAAGSDVFLLFIVSTTGDGECPSNMRETWRLLLNRNIPSDFIFIKGKKNYFSVFGLGDSGYEKYNVIAKMLYNRLLQLGGEPLAYRGLGDENDTNAVSKSDYRVLAESICADSTMEGREFSERKKPRSGVYVELFPWLREVRAAIVTLCLRGKHETRRGSDELLRLPITRSVAYVESFLEGPRETTSKRRPVACITKNNRITVADHFQDVRHIDITVPKNVSGEISTLIPYPGCLFGFYPPNSLKNVSRILKYVSFPFSALKNAVDKYKTFNSSSAYEELLKVCSEDALPIIKKESDESSLTNQDLFELICLAQLAIKVDEAGAPVSTDGNPERGSLSVSFTADEAMFSKRWISALDLFLFGLDLEKPPRLSFLRQVLYWYCHDTEHPDQSDSQTLHELFTSHPTTTQQNPISRIPDVKEKLQEFLSCEGTREYDNYFVKAHRSMADFFEEFDVIIGGELPRSPFIMPFEDFVSYCPFIQPRMYSISSCISSTSDSTKTNQVSITVGMAEYRALHGKDCIGHASRYFQENSSQSALPRPFFREGKVGPTFAYSTDPIVFIATGVGISACRSIYLSRRKHFSESNGDERPEDIMIYGCRYSTKDFLYKNDFEACFPTLVEGGKFPTVAFSRETPGHKRYVQHLIQDDGLTLGERSFVTLGKHIADLITLKNASVFVCGSSQNLPRDIRSALTHVLTKYGTGIENEQAAKMFLARLVRSKKLIMDTW